MQALGDRAAPTSPKVRRNADLEHLVDRAIRPDLSPSATVQGPTQGIVQGKAAGHTARGVVADDSDAASSASVHDVAAAGVRGSGRSLPHLEQIQRSFGDHDVTAVKAHIGGDAATASDAIGASAYATGNDVAFKAAPDLHTSAHEAAHIVQQRAGVQLKDGVGEAGDAYERHADAVADRVVRGQSATDLLSTGPGQSGAHDAVQGDWLGAAAGAASGAVAGAGVGGVLGGPVGAVVGGVIGSAVGAVGGHLAEEASSPDAPPALEDGEVILTRNAAQANEESLPLIRTQVKDTIAAWGLTFDESRVHLASADGAAVVALRWDAAWGDRPAAREIPPSMSPIAAKAAVAAVKKLPGWAKLDAGDQTILANLLGGETNQLSQSVRDHLQPTFAGLSGKSEDEQANALKGVIGAENAVPAVVDEEVTTTATAFDLEGPVEKKNYAFRGKSADAEAWNAKFKDAVTVEIVAPKAPESGYHYHSVQKAAEAASYLPKNARAVIKTVLLNVVENPDDAYWAVEYNDPGFHSYMTAGASGVVTIYPDKAALPNDNYMRGTMIHETGHTWSYQTWGQDTSKGKWVEWKSAMDSDKVSVSGYAMASIAEDVAETIQIYVSTQGDARFDEYRAIVPNRFAMLDAEYK